MSTGKTDGMGLLPRGDQIAAATPADRDRFLDALRTSSLVLVVLGHGAMLTMTYWPMGAAPLVGNTLDSFPGAQPLTWVLQPMSLFFFAGAAANVVAWGRARDRGEGYHSWLWARVRRLYRPVLVYLAVMVPLAVVVSALIGESGQVLLMGITGLFWFIAVYTAATALLPFLHAWQRRSRLGPLLALCALVALVDLARRQFALPDAAGLPNIVLVWLVFTVLGLWYHDGLLTTTVARWLVVIGLAGLAVSVFWWGYPMSMVGTARGPSNTVPPTVALTFQGVFLIGLVVLAQRPIRALLARPRVWAPMCAASACAMTLYLWHLPSLILALALVHVSGLVPDAVAQASSGIPVPGDQYAAYLLLALPLFAAITYLAVGAFWRFEHAHLRLWDDPVTHPWRLGKHAQAWASAGAVTAVTFGVLVIGVTGFAGFPTAVSYWSIIPLWPPAALVCMVVGLLALRQLSLGPRTTVDSPAVPHT